MDHEYLKLIDKAYSDVLKQFMKLQIQDATHKSLEQTKDLIQYGNHILQSLKQQVQHLEGVMSDCQEFASDLNKSVESQARDHYIYKLPNQMLTYQIKPLSLDTNNQVEQQNTNQQADSQNIQPYDIDQQGMSVNQYIITPTPLKYNIELPTVNNLKDIPKALYTYNKGIYINLNGNIVKIPFPHIIDANEINRGKTIRCKYYTTAECYAQRLKLSKMYKSDIRPCNYAHQNDQITRVGYPARCPTLPDFGNVSTFEEDVKKITESDIKQLLLYSLHDLILSFIWLDHNRIKGKVYNRLESAS